MRWLKRSVIVAALVVASLAGIVTILAYLLLRGSLPTLDGKLTLTELSTPAVIERDALGVVTITAGNRADLAYATGYAHGQDRFFQMDLERRAAAGELSALLGSTLLPLDKRFRRHNFRRVAAEVLASASPTERQIVDAYAAGVNAALRAMSVRPFEYLLLRTKPAPWAAEDCLLAAFSMYIDLNDSLGARELERARLHAALPQAVYDVLYPPGTEWDATLDNVDLSEAHAALPDARILDLSKLDSTQTAEYSSDESAYLGSNNWALAGWRTTNGAALAANDMHLGLRLPHIWYRTRLVVASDASKAARDLIGVTLPGLPILIAGSNRHIAWGFTNSYGDFDDLVVIETDAREPNRYRDDDRYREYSVRSERIEVRGGAAVDVEYRDTIWGPLLDETLDGKPLAVAWTAQHPEATNFRQLDLEGASTANQAIEIATAIGIPAQNFVVADAEGHIGWTLIGKLPKRSGIDGRFPACWGCSANLGWTGWISSADYPRIVDPANGQLWSANSRTLGGSGFDLIGDEGMDRGARATQIRDALLALQKATPADMLRIQLDDRALFLKRWRDLLVRMQDEAYLKGHNDRRVALRLVESWSGAASVDDAGYRIVRAFRDRIQNDLFNDLIVPAERKFPGVKFKPSPRFEDTAWRIVTSQPAHLLNPKYERWDLRILAALDRAIEQLRNECDVSDKTLSECTWGRRNTLNMEHPLASLLPLIGRNLRMPRDSLPGDNDMPRVQGAAFGASERFAVSPGHEAEGYFHMPGGQSGHPLSPFFNAGHEAWVNGQMTPFFPGEPRHRLELSPPL